MAAVADVIGAGWDADPLEPTRCRFWDGAGWTARVSPADVTPADPGAAELAWTPALTLLPPPQREPALAPGGRFAAVDPMVAAFGADTRVARRRAASRRRRRLVPMAIAAAAVLVAGATVAGAGILDTSDQRPRLLALQSYRDAQAGFELRYPDGWRVLHRDRNGGIRFAIGAIGAPTTETNMVSVIVGATPAALPQLHSLADQLTETLRRKLPGVRLESAARARLAAAPGFRFEFRDTDSTPATRVEQYVGRTTSGRPLTVTVTIREPRTAPTSEQLRDFVGSLDPS